MGRRAVILSVGNDSELLHARSQLLLSAGYSVIEESDWRQVIPAAMNDNIDLVLLCHTLKKHQVEFLVMSLGEARRLLPVLCVRFPEKGAASSVSIPHATELLLDDVQTLLPLELCQQNPSFQ